MQIKRFEAEDMTDALRMVKREFGDDAVILSAKEKHPGGFFSAFRKKSVEITAATDYPAHDDPHDRYDFSKQLADQLDGDPEKDRVSLTSKSPAFTPLNARAESTEDPSMPSDTIRPVGRSKDRLLSDRPVPVKPAVATDRAADEGRTNGRERQRLTAAPFYRDLSGRKIIALVGAHGTGKSTAIAKLARHCTVVEKQTVALISLDRFHIGANGTLEKISRIMDLPFVIVRDAEQLRAALDEQTHADVVLIDTPGIARDDTGMLGDVARLLETAVPDETHLVVNATVRQAVLGAWVDGFQALGIDRLFLTHMDEPGIDDTVLDLIRSHRLPSSFYSHGVDLFDHLKETTVDGLERCCSSVSPTRPRASNCPTPTIASFVEKAVHRIDGDRIHFVANRNSELFHHPDCRSVKRINAENITAFGSIEQAMEEGFKPCRACCNIETIRKSVPSIFGSRRMRAI